jgi:hypothetical protein
MASARQTKREIWSEEHSEEEALILLSDGHYTTIRSKYNWHFKATATLEPEPTQHNSLGRLQLHSFSSLSYDRSKANSKASSPYSAIQSFLLQIRVSFRFFNVIQ